MTKFNIEAADLARIKNDGSGIQVTRKEARNLIDVVTDHSGDDVTDLVDVLDELQGNTENHGPQFLVLKIMPGEF